MWNIVDQCNKEAKLNNGIFFFSVASVMKMKNPC